GKVYNCLCQAGTNNRIIVTTYFEHSCEATIELSKTDIWGLGLDFVHGKDNLKSLTVIKDKTLVAGVVNGRNIWINDLSESLKLLDTISQKISKNKIIISTSCSLLHVPYTKENEPHSDLTKWFAFAREKVKETALLAELFFCNDHKQYSDKITHNSNLINTRARSDMFTDQTVTQRIADISKTEREGNAAVRLQIQKKAFNLAELPTTTIGSFPQTAQIRKTRSDYKNERISQVEYDDQIKAYIDDCISFQENIGLDVLVHGEPERNDMVEYFGEMLNGFHFTKKGWVQSYGSRCVKPPVIYADISRPAPMTVKWISYAQSKTNKMVKGMLTGPVTIINWSFVREDIPRSIIAKQIAIALRDEIEDLQKAGIKIIQVDEAAFKEGYPLREESVSDYEEWALESFKISVSSARKETQIHTHMCYSEFNDIIETIEKMDADVITIETARSGNRLLRIFREREYKSEIGPGVYDIHSPRIPKTEEIRDEILKRLEVVDRDKVWINPDCGLKTRRWEEVKPALLNMVEAAKALRLNNRT
ncbi:MAG TPA: 5-methyltetrahydropteroyltriglutamate--homocysteine S-methyltransferase, partial [Spirochaetota bacterium]|nr:5-methyltetrahydropteroyltriglutamate--homocysteine S-methyltransferase [Spirochaetota bacterium]